MFNIINLNKNNIVEKFILDNKKFISAESESLKIVIGNAFDIRSELVLEEDVIYITNDVLLNVCYILVDSIDNSVSILSILFNIFNENSIINVDMNDLKPLVEKNDFMQIISCNGMDIKKVTEELISKIDISLLNKTKVIFSIVTNENTMFNVINEAILILRNKIGDDADVIFSSNVIKGKKDFTLSIIIT